MLSPPSPLFPPSLPLTRRRSLLAGVPGNRQPLLSKYLVAGLGLPHVNTSSLILHGSLTPAKAGALELAATGAACRPPPLPAPPPFPSRSPSALSTPKLNTPPPQTQSVPRPWAVPSCRGRGAKPDPPRGRLHPQVQQLRHCRQQCQPPPVPGPPSPLPRPQLPHAPPRTGHPFHGAVAISPASVKGRSTARGSSSPGRRQRWLLNVPPLVFPRQLPQKTRRLPGVPPPLPLAVSPSSPPCHGISLPLQQHHLSSRPLLQPERRAPQASGPALRSFPLLLSLRMRLESPHSGAQNAAPMPPSSQTLPCLLHPRPKARPASSSDDLPPPPSSPLWAP